MNASRLTASVTLLALLSAGVLATGAQAAEAGRMVIAHRGAEAAAPGQLPRLETTALRVASAIAGRRLLPRVGVVGRSLVPQATLPARQPVRGARPGTRV